jgi:hypothetical protein
MTSLYYSECAPSVCVYTYSQRLDILYVVTTIFSLFGGLTVIFRLLTPIGLQLIKWMISYCCSRHQSTNEAAMNDRRGIVSDFLD